MLPAVLAAALVWIPPESFTQWSKVDGLLRARPDLKLTIALTPAMATPLARAALGPWAANGRVEIAARAPGDPVLPLVAAHPASPRPDDALERPASARSAVERRMRVASAGFVPGDGALDASLTGPLGASGAPWVLAGPYEGSGSTWAAEGRTTFVPARPADLAPGTPVPAGALVADESLSTAPVLLAALADGRIRPAKDWATVSELARSAGDGRAPADAIASWPGWSGAPAAAPEDPAARAAWDAYGQAAKALARYQNSGAADLKVLEGATSLLRKAQDARFYRAPAPDAAPGLPSDLRSRLLAVYKRLKVPAPDALFEVGASTAAAEAAETPTGVRTASGADWVSFDNPVGSSARLPPGAPNADPWRLRGLRVEWDDRRVLFVLSVGRADAAPPAPRPAYDVYMDLNHVLGAGSIRLLEGRGAFAQARDAWEFALSVSGTGARLWRAGPGDPEELDALKAEPDPAKAEVRVEVPRERLRGNPARWGFILLSRSDDSPSAGVLGLLAPAELQKDVLEHPGAARRVSAVRLSGG